LKANGARTKVEDRVTKTCQTDAEQWPTFKVDGRNRCHNATSQRHGARAFHPINSQSEQWLRPKRDEVVEQKERPDLHDAHNLALPEGDQNTGADGVHNGMGRAVRCHARRYSSTWEPVHGLARRTSSML
jgi:hypothetical protein